MEQPAEKRYDEAIKPKEEIVDVGNYSESEPEYGFELYYGLLKEHLVTYGILSENQMERYIDGSIENLDVTGVSRVCWIETEITEDERKILQNRNLNG